MNSFGNNLIMSVFELKLFHIITTEEILSLKNSQYVGNKAKARMCENFYKFCGVWHFIGIFVEIITK